MNDCARGQIGHNCCPTGSVCRRRRLRAPPAGPENFLSLVHVTSGGKFNFIIITLEVATRRQRQLGLLMPQFRLSNNNSEEARSKGAWDG